MSDAQAMSGSDGPGKIENHPAGLLKSKSSTRGNHLFQGFSIDEFHHEEEFAGRIFELISVTVQPPGDLDCLGAEQPHMGCLNIHPSPGLGVPGLLQGLQHTRQSRIRSGPHLDGQSLATSPQWTNPLPGLIPGMHSVHLQGPLLYSGLRLSSRNVQLLDYDIDPLL